jgi:serine/threonine-protein kinase
VAEHIGGCDACCAALRGVPDDTFGNLARAAGAAVAPAVPTPGPVGDLALPGVTQVDQFPPELADHPRYKLLGELGAGGMGVVYKAEHRIMDRVVALKVLAPHLTARPGAAERFLKEVKLAAKLGHENVVTVHDAEKVGGLLFLAMEFVEGVSLDRLVARKGPLAVPVACSFARQAALGLQHAAERGLTHRDIKPQNLMVTRKGKVKVLDFGLARFVRNDDGEEAPAPGRVPFGAGRPVSDPLTNPNLVMGTPDYLSPEQARNSHTVDHRSDIYSLGCTLFFLLTGRPPFSHASTLIDKLLAHTEEAPPPVRELRPEVPEALAAVLAKMTAKNPDDRFASASEAASALAPFLRADGPEVVEAVMVAPAGAVPAAARPAASDTAPVPDGPTVPEGERPRKPRKAKKARALPWWKKPWAKVAAVAALGLLVAVAIAASRGKKDTTTPPDNTAKPPDGTPDPKGSPPAAPVDAKPLPLLYVVPSAGVWEKDYTPVVEALEKGGVSVVTASGKGEPASRKDSPWKTIPVSKKLGDVKAADYSGVAFCGYNVDEYVGTGEHSEKVRALIEEMRRQNKPVAAICVGQRVLVRHGLFRDKFAAHSSYLQQDFGEEVKPLMRGTVRQPVHLAMGKIITAGRDTDAGEFAQVLLKALAAK